MAGSISLSLSQQFDNDGDPLAGGLLYFFQSGTTTPQSAFQDVALTIPHPNPIELDAGGRVPAFYLADGSIKIRLADAAGVTILTSDGLLVIGPSSGGGGAPAVDATTVLATGDVKVKYGTGALTGFVRLNGRTIGSATSGGTERAHADTQALFEYLWTADANLAVSGGRGASANADWLSNKTIALPDGRGRVLAALDDMGASAAGRLTSGGFGSSGIVLGQSGGAESKVLITANLPPYTPTGSVGITDPGHTHPDLTDHGDRSGVSAGAGGTPVVAVCTDATGGSSSVQVASNTTGITATLTGTAQGGTSTAFATVQPTLLVTIYIKL